MPKHTQNAIGPQLARHRNSLSMSQADFSAHCQRLGWDISRETLAKIESGIRCVTDVELTQISKALKIAIPSLFPASKQYLFLNERKS
jgi:DNA-binding XRE family transcriptional regulator